jgi:23S rRNA (cytosine1962-C5)-methyltransferase
VSTADDGYALLDCGDGRRLERFGARVINRPAPAATDRPRAGRSEWARADLRYERALGWSGRDHSAWTVAVDGLTLELRPTPSGQVGLFPEHATFWPWLRDAVAGTRGQAPAVLHLFASTGATTLALARSGAQVTHLDASRPAVAWARRNAALSGLADRPVRWIVDDALAFVRREARRERLYDGVVLDPPSYGHGPGGVRWELREALPEMLSAVRAVTMDDAFVLLTAHPSGVSADDLRDAMAEAFGGAAAIAGEPIELEASSGAVLPLGAAVRMIRG